MIPSQPGAAACGRPAAMHPGSPATMIARKIAGRRIDSVPLLA
jgi:hypothetical protein